MKGAPKYDPKDTASIELCKQFIDKFITAENHPELARYQMHHHTHTCRKRVRKKMSTTTEKSSKASRIRLGHNEICRFGIPYPPVKQTVILEPLNCKNKFEKQRHRDNLKIIKRALEDIRGTCKTKLPPSTDEFMLSIGIDSTDYINAIRSGIRKTTVFLRRSPKDSFINGYNPKIAEIWEGNMDLQFITDPFSCCRSVSTH